MTSQGACVSVNPANGKEIGRYPHHAAAEVERRVALAAAAFESWRKVTPAERVGPLRVAATSLRAHKAGWAERMALEMGKPVTQGISEVEKCALACEYYADHAAEFLSDLPVDAGRRKSLVCHRPLGPVLAIMPWNFPFWQVFRAAAPALAAGNPVLLKHAGNVTGCALDIERIWKDAGLPDGLFQALVLSGPTAAGLLADSRIRGVSFTGSTEAGRSVAELAGRHLKKAVLELGGSDPYVVLEDADLEVALGACATGRMINNGQSCIAAKRLIVVEKVREAFERRLCARFGQFGLGDPLDPATAHGPMARADLRDELHGQVMASVAAGAQLQVGGVIPDMGGAWYPATVLTGVRPGMPAFDQELFGPVACVIPARDRTEALELANRTSFGLGAAVFTQDLEAGEAIARTELEAGSAFVNTFVASDPRLPFGGVKDSGLGRELGPHGIREFTNIKTVVVA